MENYFDRNDQISINIWEMKQILIILAEQLLKALFALVGLGLLIATWYWVGSTRDFLASADLSEGKVVAYESEYDSDSGETIYYPVVLFKGREMYEPRQFTADTGGRKSYEIGETVEVLYVPGTSDQPRINSFFSLWLGPMIVGILGLMCFAGGCLILLATWGKRL